eukprot:6266573-Prymnesium_polylepis.1
MVARARGARRTLACTCTASQFGSAQRRGSPTMASYAPRSNHMRHAACASASTRVHVLATACAICLEQRAHTAIP